MGEADPLRSQSVQMRRFDIWIACVAQGVLLGAISESESARLLYAVQVAQGLLRSQSNRKPSESSRENLA